jgi:hypothetical protein
VALYGSEIWGYFPASKWEKQINKYISKETDSLITEKLHTKFCKYALGANLQTLLVEENWAAFHFYTTY